MVLNTVLMSMQNMLDSTAKTQKRHLDLLTHEMFHELNDRILTFK